MVNLVLLVMIDDRRNYIPLQHIIIIVSQSLCGYRIQNLAHGCDCSLIFSESNEDLLISYFIKIIGVAC